MNVSSETKVVAATDVSILLEGITAHVQKVSNCTMEECAKVKSTLVN